MHIAINGHLRPCIYIYTVKSIHTRAYRHAWAFVMMSVMFMMRICSTYVYNCRNAHAF